MTQELALRIGQSETDHIVSWLSVLRTEAGNPLGVNVRRFGRAIALSNAGASLGPLFNRVLNWGETELETLDEILLFYHEKGNRCRIDVNPYATNPALFRCLNAAGLYPFRFHDFLYATPEMLARVDRSPIPANVQARPIRREDLPAWTSVWREGFVEVLGADKSVLSTLSSGTARLYDEPGWTLYLACIDGVPAASSALYLQNGIATLAIAGTPPRFRRRGCQAALLRARLDDAIAQDCDLIVAQAALNVTSHHNMERVGLQVAYTRAFWLQQS